MRFLIVGLGSMGKRRVRNLQHLKAGDVAGFDPRADRRDEAHSKYSIPTFEDFENALATFRPDALLISTPRTRGARSKTIATSSRKQALLTMRWTSSSVYRSNIPNLSPRLRARCDFTRQFSRSNKSSIARLSENRCCSLINPACGCLIGTRGKTIARST